MVEGIEWIQRKKKLLLIAGSISALICIGEIIYLHSAGEASFEKWQFAIFILPWFVTFSIILALWHENLSAGKQVGVFVTIQRVLYWLVLPVFCFITGTVILRFIL